MAMSEDLYTKWLNIPPGVRPPASHVLLGIDNNTSDTRAIDAAAELRMEELDRFALSSDRATREQVQRLMNEIAKARTRMVKRVAMTSSATHRKNVPAPSRSATAGSTTPISGQGAAGNAPRRAPRPAQAVANPSGLRLPRDGQAFWLLIGTGWAFSIVLVALVVYFLASPPDVDPLASQIVPLDDAAKRFDTPVSPQAEPKPQPEPESGPEPKTKPEIRPQPEPPPHAESLYSEAFTAYLKERDSLARQPEAQAALIKQKLSELNGGIPINLEIKIRRGRLAYLWLLTDRSTPRTGHENHNITDLSPLIGMQISFFVLQGLEKVESFEFLKTMRVESLQIHGNDRLELETVAQVKGLRGVWIRDIKATDLQAFKGLKLNEGISFDNIVGLTSLDGLEGMNLKSLYIYDCPQLSDISALSKVTVSYGIGFRNTAIADISPLKGMRRLRVLQFVNCPSLQSLEGLETITTLEKLELSSNAGLSVEEVQALQTKMPDLDMD